MNTSTAEQNLSSFDPKVRQQALDALVAAWQAGEIPCAPPNDQLNLHCHTFFSYNGYGHSPSALAWLARKLGWYAVGTVDFDVLDAMQECLDACDRVQVRGMAGMETRAYLPQFATREINSPGEPGILYYMGVGFVYEKTLSPADEALADLRQRAAERNRDVVARVNAYLDPVVIDYDRDVLPLTPAGNATERHILLAYDIAARKHFPEREDLLRFWASRLEMDVAQVDAFMGDEPFPHDAIRSKLIKRGGVGYVQPGPDTFPPFDEVTDTIIKFRAIPTYAWLDGTSAGEQAIEELLALAVSKGVGAINIIPDRNWNIKNPDERALKIQKLYEVVQLAHDMDLPILVGTEMNKAGQKVVDDFDAEPLRPLHADFIAGAHFVYGHTVMERALRQGYQSEWALEYLPERRDRNAFYQEVGRLVLPGKAALARVAQLSDAREPQAILARLQEL
ncbi:MAG: hypothetical protein GX552_06980 [Chloroflexi bacterium]|nr:hypothetical protein [Chloroflexota bacterium]